MMSEFVARYELGRQWWQGWHKGNKGAPPNTNPLGVGAKLRAAGAVRAQCGRSAGALQAHCRRNAGAMQAQCRRSVSTVQAQYRSSVSTVQPQYKRSARRPMQRKRSAGAAQEHTHTENDSSKYFWSRSSTA